MNCANPKWEHKFPTLHAECVNTNYLKLTPFIYILHAYFVFITIWLVFIYSCGKKPNLIWESQQKYVCKGKEIAAKTGRSLGFCRSMSDTSFYIYPHFLFTWKTLVLLLASILLPMIVTAKSELMLWHAADCTGKLPCELYIIIITIVKTCFACAHF